MKNLKTLSKRGLALFISLVMCLGMLPATAMAEEGDTISVDVPVGAKAEDLAAALTRDVKPEATEWYYYSRGTVCSGSWLKLGTLNHKAKKTVTVPFVGSQEVEVDCYHTSPLLSAVGNSTITVSPSSTGSPEYIVDVHYVNRETPHITAQDAAEPIMLVYKSDLSGVDYAAVEAEILEKVNASVDVTGEGTFAVGESLTKKGIDGITAGTQNVYIHWSSNSNDYWSATPVKVSVTFTDRTPSAITEKTPGATYTVALQDTTKTDRQKVLDAVVGSFTIGGEPADQEDLIVEPAVLTEETESVAISYPGTTTTANASITVNVECRDTRATSAIAVNAEEVDGVYTVTAPCNKDGSVNTGKVANELSTLVTVVDDEGNEIDGAVVTVEHVKENSYKISYAGNETYKSTSTEVTVNVIDGREESAMLLSADSYTAKIVYNDDGSVNVAATEKSILAAVANVTEGVTETPTITYYAKARTGSAGSLGRTWIGLGGGREGLLTYPAIPEGDQQIRIDFAGDDGFKPFHAEITVNMKGKEPSNVVLVDGTTVYNRSTDVIKQYIFENCIDWANSEIPAKGDVSWDDFEYQYEATLSLIDEIGQSDALAKYATQWVPFEGKTLKEVVSGGNDTVGGILDGLGGLIGKIPGVDQGVMEDLIENASYPAIGAGEQKIRVIYKGNKDYAPGAFGDDTPTAILTITKAPAKVTVNSTVIPVKEVQPGLPGFITTDPTDVGTVTVYAGLNRNAKPVVYIDLSQADSVFKNLPKLLGLDDENGTNLAELYKKLTDSEIAKWLEKAGISTDITGKLIDAIAGLINNDTISGIISGNKDAIADLINKGLGSAGTAIEQMGDVTVYFRTPEEPGLYGVASFVSDKNYEANPNIAVGYLVITMDAIKVTVGNESIQAGAEIPAGFVTTNPHTDNVCVIYAGLPAGVWLDVPEAYQWDEVATVGELRAKLNREASGGTAAVGLNYNVVNKLLEAVTRFDLPGIDSVPVHYGTPNDVAGVYTVTAIASNGGEDIPGVGVGTLRVGLNKDVSVKVNSATIKVGEEIPEDLVVTDPEDVRTLVLYAGVNAGDGRLTGQLYLDGLSEKDGVTMTLDELRQRLADNEILDDYQLISAILEKLPETKAGSWTVTTGQPPVEAGSYTVVAGAIRSGSVPAVDVGTLTIIDWNMTWIRYAATEGGSVSPEREAVTSTNKLQGSTATANEGYHFVGWTKGELLPEKVSADEHFTPDKPAGIWDIRDMIYTARFERHTWSDEVTVNKAATCTEDGEQERKCTQCDAVLKETIPATGHTMGEDGEVTKAPTCTEEGEKTYTCTACGVTATEAISATGHAWGDWENLDGDQHRHVCGNNPSHTEEKAHDWAPGAVTAAPTCQTEGVRTCECRDCGATKTEAVEKASHRVATSSATPEVPATCTSEGTRAHWHCEDCGKDFADPACTRELTSLVIPRAPHTWDEGVQMSSSCEGAGVMRYTCTKCGTTKDVEEIPAAGHTWDNGVKITVASCANAEVTQYTCTKCGTIKLVAGSALGHDMVNVPAEAATCVAAGHEAGQQCSRCKAMIGMDLVGALGHHEVTDDAVAATCAAAGHEAGTHCDRDGCDYTTGGAPIAVDPNNHTGIVIDAAVAPTCQTTGLTEGSHCEDCHAVVTAQNTVPTVRHTEGDGVVTVRPTAATPGVRTYSCTVCGAVIRTESIPALGEEQPEHTHSYTAAVTAPTCTAQGYTTYTCSCGESYVGSYVPAAGHSAVADAAVAPTCEDTGLSAGEHCANCGTVLTAQTVVPATGHSWDAGVITVYPTYTSTGVRTYTCAACGATRTGTIPALTYTDPGYTYPTNPGTGGGTTISDGPTPLAPAPGGEDISDNDVPLASVTGLNTTEHYAYVQGYEDGTVHPLDNIKRGEVFTIFFRLMTEEYRVANWATTNSFTDAVEGDWYNIATSVAAKAGLVKGYEDGSVRPDDYISHAEFVAMAARFFTDELTDEGAHDYNDTVGHWAAEAIRKAANAGMITWVEDGNFRPDEYITRAEVMMFINRMLDRIPDAEHMLDDMKTWSDNPAGTDYYADVQEATNGHKYERAEGSMAEIWTEMTEPKDWKALQDEWIANNGASAPAAESDSVTDAG